MLRLLKKCLQLCEILGKNHIIGTNLFSGGQMKIYAVKNGRKTGLFYSWDDCRMQVMGYSDAQYKSFDNKEEALEYLGEVYKSKIEVDAYVDGSFDERRKKYSYACVFLSENNIIDTLSGCSNSGDDIDMRNVAGEIEATMSAIKWCMDKGYRSIKIFYDYEGIGKWASGEWKANKVGTRKYVEFIQESCHNMDINFCKVKGHSGNIYNEMVDRLAKEALEKSDEIDCISVFEDFVQKNESQSAQVIYLFDNMNISEKTIIAFAKMMIRRNGYKKVSELSVRVLVDDKIIVVTFMTDNIKIEERYRIML